MSHNTNGDRIAPRGVDDVGSEDGAFELGQMHWAPSSYGAGFQEEALLAGLCDAYDEGLIRAVGLSNFGPKSLRKVHRKLHARGVPVATLQVRCREARLLADVGERGERGGRGPDARCVM